MCAHKPLSQSFYARDTLIVAKELLGKILVRQLPEGSIKAKIVEVEAYKGREDPASHAYKGSTPRNQLMFGKAGFSYIYFIYGNHYCLNVTAEREGIPGAVLIRAVEIIDGVELAQKNRKAKSLTDLSNGPGKLTKALNITKSQNGIDLTTSQKLFIVNAHTKESFEMATSKRKGIKTGVEKRWRFYLKDNEFVSHL